MDYVQPPDQMGEIITIAKVKAGLSIPAMLIRGAMAGMVLSFALLFAVKCSMDSPPGIASLIGSMIFPAGFGIITLLALELVTGNYAVVTLGWLRKEVSGRKLLRNLFFVGLGNLLGCLIFAFLMSVIIRDDRLGYAIVALAEKKTLGYLTLGSKGFMVAFLRGLLCNILVGFAAVLGLTSQSSIGRLASIWFPVAMFFALGLEHSVVNMFIIPSGMLMGAPISIGQLLQSNLVPVSLGNILGAGLVIAGGIHYSTPWKRAELNSLEQ